MSQRQLVHNILYYMIYEALAICKLLLRDVLKNNLNKAHNMRYDKARAAQRALLLEGKMKGIFING